MGLEVNSRGDLSANISVKEQIIKLTNKHSSIDYFEMIDQNKEILNIKYLSGSYFVILDNIEEEESSNEITNKEMINILNNFKLSIEHEKQFEIEEEEDYDEEDYEDEWL
jgi:hypothetical protein